MELPEYLTVTETAILLGTTVRAINLWIKEGKLPAEHHGNILWRIRREDVLAFLEARKKNTRWRPT